MFNSQRVQSVLWKWSFCAFSVVLAIPLDVPSSCFLMSVTPHLLFFCSAPKVCRVFRKKVETLNSVTTFINVKKIIATSELTGDKNLNCNGHLNFPFQEKWQWMENGLQLLWVARFRSRSYYLLILGLTYLHAMSKYESIPNLTHLLIYF